MFEEQLGLAPPIPGFDPSISFAIETTPGMVGVPGASDTRAWLPRLTITKQISALRGLVGAASLLAASLAFYRALVPE